MSTHEKASLISKKSTSLSCRPACFSAFGMARLGVVVNLCGSCSASPTPRTHANTCAYQVSSSGKGKHVVHDSLLIVPILHPWTLVSVSNTGKAAGVIGHKGRQGKLTGTPSCLAFLPDMSTRAAAPSDTGLALPAVTVPAPPKRPRSDGILAGSFLHGPSSDVTTRLAEDVRFPSTLTGAISWK